MLLQITFRDMSRSNSVERHVRRRAEKLNRFFDRLTWCHVTVGVPHRRHRFGKRYRVRIDIGVPRKELVVGRNPPNNRNHEDMHAAIDDAFDDAERIVEDYATSFRAFTKERHVAPHGIVVRLLDGYGFLEDEDGVELYFHRNSVIGDRFDELVVGGEVRYNGELGEKGPQASTVQIVGKNGRR